jgi:hypothetical protein
MKHLTAQDCVDYVRHVGPAAQDPAIAQHLESGCPRCQNSLNIWAKIADFANQEKAFKPPEALVRSVVKSYTSRRRLASPPGRLAWARLASDSLHQPIAMGVRGASTSGRQLLYQCGTISVDIRMQAAPGSGLFLLLGQLLDSHKPSDRVREISVTLLSDGLVVSEKQTNQMGEFDFGYYRLFNGQLVFSLGPKHQLVVPVPDQ